MHRAQRIERNKPKTAPQIIDTRQLKVIPQPAAVDPAIANLPLRTVLLLEVGDMEPAKVQLLVQEANKMYDGAKGGIHYVLPVRHGRIGTDVVFEGEWEKIVQETCEIRDGQIRLKDGAAECYVVRQRL
jgi:hypothetical protein